MHDESLGGVQAGDLGGERVQLDGWLGPIVLADHDGDKCIVRRFGSGKVAHLSNYCRHLARLPARLCRTFAQQSLYSIQLQNHLLLAHVDRSV